MEKLPECYQCARRVPRRPCPTCGLPLCDDCIARHRREQEDRERRTVKSEMIEWIPLAPLSESYVEWIEWMREQREEMYRSTGIPKHLLLPSKTSLMKG